MKNFFFLLGLLIISQVASANIYSIKKGDTLSGIVHRFFPSAHIYGKHGKMAEILALNPQIKNPNRIYVHKAILLEAPVEVIKEEPMAVTSEAPVIEKLEIPEPIEPTIVVKTEEGKWNLGLLYGMNVFSLSQKGDLGDISGSALDPMVWKISAEYFKSDWSFWSYAETFKFNSTSNGFKGSKQLYSLDAGLSKKSFLVGMSVQDLPLFNASDVENIKLAKQRIVFANLGFKRDLKLDEQIPTELRLKAWLRIPLTSSVDDADVAVNSPKGLGLKGQFQYIKQFYRKGETTFHWDVMGDVLIQKTSQDVKWDSVENNTSTTVFQAGLAGGVLVGF